MPESRRFVDLDNMDLVAALKLGDEEVFRRVVAQHHAALVHAALFFVRSSASAEDVAQETWLAVVKGIGSFEGRSSFKTWLFRVLVNQAMTRGKQEARVRPQSTQGCDLDHGSAAVLFHDVDHSGRDRWRATSTEWGLLPDSLVQSVEVADAIALAIAKLPELQCRVITMRDMTGLSTAEVCDLLKISPANERVLLHRARLRVRAVLESRFEPTIAA
jgi:RNA polymerase sigma-70 factor, ECF subfamily